MSGSFAAHARIAALVLACTLVASCSNPPTYVPEKADVVASSSVAGTTIHATLASGEALDVDANQFLAGPGTGGQFLLLRGSQPKAWLYQVFLSNQTYTPAGCFSMVGSVRDAGSFVDVDLHLGPRTAGTPEEIVFHLPKAPGFVNNHKQGLGTMASGTTACLDSHGVVTSSWR